MASETTTMTRKAPSLARLSCLLAGSWIASGSAFAALLDDSKASLELRNMYLNRDYREPGTATSYGEVWAQGFIARLESGYTEGTVGLGVDMVGMLGVRLDSGKGRVNGASGGGGIGMLPLERDGSRWMTTASWGLPPRPESPGAPCTWAPCSPHYQSCSTTIPACCQAPIAVA